MSVKDQVLDILQRNSGDHVSGQAMADELGVSRNAVWKAINSLRSEGCKIGSTTNKGYKLDEGCDAISALAIARAFAHPRPQLELAVFDELDSTQDEAKRMIADGFRGTAAIVARHQTGGRGRRGRSFFSPSGGVYFTLLVNGNELASDAATMTMCAAVATSRAIEANCGCQPRVKWVNDIYVDGRKVCGILSEGTADLESRTMHNVAIGIGVNVGEQDFPDDIADRAGFVELLPERTRSQLLAAIIENLLDSGVFDPAEAAGDAEAIRKRVVDEYRELSFVIGMQIEYEMGGSTHAAKALAVEDDGGLKVLDDDGTEHVLRAGEISIRF